MELKCTSVLLTAIQARGIYRNCFLFPDIFINSIIASFFHSKLRHLGLITDPVDVLSHLSSHVLLFRVEEVLRLKVIAKNTFASTSS